MRMVFVWVTVTARGMAPLMAERLALGKEEMKMKGPRIETVETKVDYLGFGKDLPTDFDWVHCWVHRWG